MAATARVSTLASALALLALGACDGGAADPSDPTPLPATSLAVGGLLAVDVQQSEHVRGFRLVNPATGKLGPLTALHYTGDVEHPMHRGPIAFSPDGVHLVFATTVDGLPVWTYGRVGVDADGAPVYTEERRIAGALGSELVLFNAAADRFFTARGWYDPATGDKHECPLAVGSAAPAVIPSPDGRHHLFMCDGATWLYDDDAPVVPLSGLAGYAQFSADGRYVLSEEQHAFDVVDRATVHYTQAGLFGATLDPGDRRRQPIVDARDRVFVTGSHGFGRTIVTGAFGECFSRSVERADDPLVRDYDLGAWVRRGDAAEPARAAGAFDRAWLELRDRYDGGEAVVVGRSADGGAALLAASLWTIEFPPDPNACEYPKVRTTRVIRVDLATDAHDVTTSGELGPLDLILVDDGARTSLDLLRVAPYGLVPEPGAVELAPGLLLTSASGGFWGLDAAGESAVFAGAGPLPTPDGRLILGARQPGPNAPGPLCATPTAGAGGRARCLEALAVRQPWAFGGHNAPGVTALSERATVMHLAPTAADVGQAVHVFGAGFGDAPGALTVGGHPVPAADIVRWGAGHITFRMSAALGTGRVLVEGPRGADADARPFVMTFTPREPTVWSAVATPALTWQQGVTRYDLAGLDADAVAKVSVRTGADLFVVPAGADLWLFARQGLADAPGRWVEAELDAWFRPVEERYLPGLAPALAGGWQVVGGGGRRDGFEHYEQLAGVVVEMRHATATRRDDTGAFVEEDVAAWGPSLPASEWGLPAHPHALDDGTLLAVRALAGAASPPSLVKILDFQRQTAWGYPRYDDAFTKVVPLGMAEVAALGDAVVVVGRDAFSLTTAAWMVSADGGATFGEPMKDAAHGRLAQLVPVTSGPLAGFLALETSGQVGVAGVVHLTPEGAPTWDVVPVPAGPAATLRLWGDGPRVFAFDPEADALAWLDTAAEAPTWQPLTPPSGALVSAFFDRAGGRLLLATTDAVYTTPLGAAPAAFTELARPTLPFGATATLRTVAALPDGALVLRADLADTRSGASGPHPIQGLLVRVPAP